MPVKAKFQSEMKRLEKTPKGTAATKRFKTSAARMGAALRITKSSPRAGARLLNRLRPEFRSLVKETVARYDEDLRRLARH